MSEELKPCPLCTGKGKLGKRSCYKAHPFEVFCLECGCRTLLWATEQEALTAWNTRAESPEIAELRAENDRLRSELGASITRRAISHCDDMADSHDEWYAEWNEEYYMGGFEFLIKHEMEYFEREPWEGE